MALDRRKERTYATLKNHLLLKFHFDPHPYEHEPKTRTNSTVSSYPRKWVSRRFFPKILLWIPASAGMTKREL